MAGSGRRERKVVTVVFCDLVGFTSRAESLDPEDVDALLGPYHERVRSELERHGGTVEKFIGDAVMALFGAPTAHEDDPERAVRAALAIREFALEEGLELRVGITTGEALVRLDASPEAGEGMASGDVVNTAARLQGSAPVNGVVVDETTYRATRTTIDYDESEPVEAKGKAEPIPVWTALAVRSRPGVDVPHEMRSPLVGRSRELGILRDAFERVRHERIPQLVTLVGVPGIGKSRLAYELQRIADADPDLVTWRQGRCLAYGDGVTLWAVAEIVKAQAGISEQDAPAEVTAKLSRSVSNAVSAEDAAWVESHLRALVGLAEEGELGGDRRDEAFSAWRRYFEGIADQRPAVLVFEDLHWADESLLDFVDDLVDWVTDAPLLVLATARPELLERRPTWGGGKLNATTLALAPLDAGETTELLAAVLGAAELDGPDRAALVERAGGNPLYAEQFAELYLERGSTAELTLPESLQGVIAARLDVLAPDEKGLLLDAAVVGKVFWTGALQRDRSELATTFLALERKGYIRRQRRSSVEGESELAFAHALVRDVAYGQIPRAERADKHRHVAVWIESLGRPEDHAEMRAYHWRSALDLSRASGADDPELAERARLSLRDAGDRAFDLNVFATAASLYDDALSLWPDTPDRADLLFRRARALFQAYDEDRRAQALEEARDALLACGDDVRAGEAEGLLGNVAWDRGDRAAVEHHLERARALVGTTPTPSTARVLSSSARMLALTERHEEALEVAAAALALAEDLGLREIYAHTLATTGTARNALAPGSGQQALEDALAIAREIDSPVASSITNNLAVEALFDADLVRAEALYEDAHAIAERLGDRGVARFVDGNRIFVRFARGHWDQALSGADAFIALCEAGSPHTQESTVRQTRAMIREGRGDEAGAVADARRACDLIRVASAPMPGRMGALAILATVLTELGRPDEGRAVAVDELLPLVREFGPHGALPRLAVVAGELGLVDELRESVALNPSRRARWGQLIELTLDGELTAAADLAAETGFVPIEARLRIAAGEALLRAGTTEDAVAELERGRDLYAAMGATFYVARAERGLASARSAST